MLSGIAGSKSGAGAGIGAGIGIGATPAPVTFNPLLMQHQQQQQQQLDRKAAYRPLLLDALGRQVDDKGNVVKEVSRSVTHHQHHQHHPSVSQCYNPHPLQHLDNLNRASSHPLEQEREIQIDTQIEKEKWNVFSWDK